MTTNKFNTAGVSSTSTQVELTVKDLMPNNYLTIVWKDTATGKIASTLDINDEKASEYTISLNNAIDQAINSQKINYFGQKPSWMYHKLEAEAGSEEGFTEEELFKFKGALCDLADRIRRVADSL